MAASKKKRIFQIILFLGTAISLYFVPWNIVTLWIQPLPDTIQEQIDISSKYDYDGMIVYVDQKGKTPKTYTTGWHDRDKKIAAKPDALFKIASINKLFTALAIAKLHSSNKISLDKTLADYFPEYKDKIANANKVKLRQLVQHKSGIPNYSDTPNYWSNPVKSFEENLELIFNMPPNFEPGEGYEYSNTNYLLLGELINRVSGYSYFEYIKQEILIPLDLKNTFSSVNDVDINRVMGGYHIGYPHNLRKDDLGMVASIQDIGKFIRSLNDGTAFKANEREVYDSIYLYEHSGWVPGYQSFARYDKDSNTVLVLFNNTTDKDLYLWNLSEIFCSRILKIHISK